MYFNYYKNNFNNNLTIRVEYTQHTQSNETQTQVVTRTIDST